MSVLKNPEVTPNRMNAVYKWLLRRKGHSESIEKLKHLVIPDRFVETKTGNDRGDQFVGKVLNEMDEIGIVERSDGNVQLSEAAIRIASQVSEDFRRVFSGLLLTNTRNEDLLYAIAFSYTLDPFHTPSSWVEFESVVKAVNCQEITSLKNDPNYGNFIYWSTYLGFAWQYLTYVPDPTEHIKWILRSEFDRNEYPIKEFLSQLSLKLPVIDGGYYYRSIQSQIGKPAIDNTLSKTLSLALLRLSRAGLIEIRKQADTEMIYLAKEFDNKEITRIIIK